MERNVVGVLVAGVVALAWAELGLRGRVERLEGQRAILDAHVRVLRGEIGTFGRWLDLATTLEARVNRLDPLADPGRCGPACRTEMAAPPGVEKAPWCTTHRRWWAPETLPGRCTDQCPLVATTIHEAGKNDVVVQWCATHHRAY